MDKIKLFEKIETISRQSFPENVKALRVWQEGLFIARDEEDSAALYILKNGKPELYQPFDNYISMVFFINRKFKVKWPWKQVSCDRQD